MKLLKFLFSAQPHIRMKHPQLCSLFIMGFYKTSLASKLVPGKTCQLKAVIPSSQASKTSTARLDL